MFNSEFIRAIEDNVSTTHKVVSVETEGDVDEKSGVISNNITESVQDVIELTYADTWFVKAEKETSYLTGEKEVKGEVNNTSTTSVNVKKVYAPSKKEGKEGKVAGTVKEITTTNTISNKYDTGKEFEVTSKDDDFVKLFKDDNPDVFSVSSIAKAKWLIENIEKNASQMTDITKYYFNVLFDKEVFKNVDKDNIFEKFKNNTFTKASKRGRISYASLNITDEDREILYKITTAENGGAELERQKYIVSVILNRVLCSQYPNTVREVVFAPKQFQPTRNGAYDAAKPSDLTKQAVDDVIANGGTTVATGFMNPQATSQGYMDGMEKYGWYFLFNDVDDSWKLHNFYDGSVNYFANKKDVEELQQYMMGGSGSIIESCENIMNLLLERGGRYPLTSSGVWIYGADGMRTGDIRTVVEHDKYACCATYVSMVLYDSGTVSEDIINRHNYNYTGGIDEILEEAPGWSRVNPADKQPGDVINNPGATGHVCIYAGGDKIYDQSSGVISSKGAAPKRGAWSYPKYANSTTFTVWHYEP